MKQVGLKLFTLLTYIMTKHHLLFRKVQMIILLSNSETISNTSIIKIMIIDTKLQKKNVLTNFRYKNSYM